MPNNYETQVMRSITSLFCLAVVLILAGCSSVPNAPDKSYAGLNDPYLYSDSGTSPIPPSARARREGNPYPNAQGVSPQVRAQVQQQQYTNAPPQGYYASPQARAQVNSEISAETQKRGNAFGSITRGQPRPIDLGPGPGLTRISPNASYGEQTSLYSQPQSQPREYSSDNVPSGAPPLPSTAQPGECYELLSGGNGYSWRQTSCDAQTQTQNGLVSDLQRVLDRAGYSPGPIDGIFGPRTLRALNAYQRDRNLPVDSQLRPSTFRDMGLSRR